MYTMKLWKSFTKKLNIRRRADRETSQLSSLSSEVPGTSMDEDAGAAAAAAVSRSSGDEDAAAATAASPGTSMDEDAAAVASTSGAANTG